ncbi:MAG: 30S ribosomal protein S17e [Nanoarchaeota archaeon]|nr:30S ribosomal protein S17e [Nanoarchaeota archaeon]
MGRIRTTFIKSKSEELLRQYPDKFTSDFQKNKKMLDELVDIPSKQLRNKIAGAIVHLVKQSKETEVH